MDNVESAITYYHNYTPVGDVLVMGLCLVIVVLMQAAYIVRTKNFRIFQLMILSLILAAVTDMGYHILLNNIDDSVNIYTYVLRALYHFFLFSNLFLYIIYVMEPLNLNPKTDKRYVVIAAAGFIGGTVYDVLGTVLGFGFRIEDSGKVYEGFNIFSVGYVFFVGIILFLLIRYRARLAKQILFGIIGTYVVSFLLISIQGMHGQTSFTSAAFLFPAITLFYLIHSNPYDIELGAVGVGAFEDLVTFLENHKNEKRVIISLFMHEFESESKNYPREMIEMLRDFSYASFKGATLFQLSNGRIALSLNPKKNPNYEKAIQSIEADFDAHYSSVSYDCKIVCLETVSDVTENHDYVRLMRFVEEGMHENSIHFIDEKDLENFREMNYILLQLKDIAKSDFLDDPRVEVYTQPVLNITTKKYDTAEALMRLSLPKIGRVLPYKFIPLAEEYGFIHRLSLIILHKTCVQIKRMLEEGYVVQRISVNFAVKEVRDPNFISDINKVIDDVGIPHEKVAIEITESQNEKDFNIVKNTIDLLRDNGIKFYLDDFGTGYSNFERILELPFDTIKFDRSLVIASGEDQKSEKMITYLARMFSAMNYAVLYEGIETDEDEEKCIKMNANYLQGFKYSKPIPIEELVYWFDKSAV
ncbi:MAG: EAL domain-containing protein [Eubacterium sp.]|nr:EAL domain-containing protein [Eubacterium sp.]